MADRKDIRKVASAALAARRRAYAPYSRFAVGAAVKAHGANGKIYTGCNVENASYGATICAERVAITKAVSEGDIKFDLLAVATESAKPAPLCGVCLQFLSEFCDDVEIVLVSSRTRKVELTTLKQLLPIIFRLESDAIP